MYVRSLGQVTTRACVRWNILRCEQEIGHCVDGAGLGKEEGIGFS